jgi:hypothetical protein
MINTTWLAHHFQGRLFQLGRLQFELGGLGGTTSAEIRAAGTDLAPGSPMLLVHIPDYCGPKDATSCTASLEAARGFFGRHFPQHRPAVLTGYSWLLDPQLNDYLPEDSNIVNFQRLFTINQRRTRPTATDRSHRSHRSQVGHRHANARLVGRLLHVPARVVMDVLGHSQLAITTDLYSHVMPSALREAADAIDRALDQ